MISQLDTADQQTFTYDYVPHSSLLDTLTASSGLTVARHYEPNRDVMTRVKNTVNATVVSQYDYVYDGLRRRTSMTTSGTAIDTLPQPIVPEEQITYTTNNLNQYTTVDSDGTEVSLLYDLDGNLTDDGTFQYVYDAENRLISATPLDTTSGLKKVEFSYDYMSRRVAKNVFAYTAGAWTLDTTIEFVYDGWNLIKDTITAGGSTSTEYYVWGLDLSGTVHGAGGPSALLRTGIGGLLLRKTDTGNYLYLYDAGNILFLSNVGQLLNASDGSLAARYEYDAFGNLLVADGPEAQNNPFRFSTKYRDVETGLVYYGYRYYAPELGRWWTRDLIGEQDHVNLYLFVNNNSVNAQDYLGLYTSWWPMVKF